MKYFLFILFILFTVFSSPLFAQNYYYALSKEQENLPENAIEITNVDQLIAELKSDRNLYLKAGHYKLPTTQDLMDISNLQVTGADGAVITGDLITLIQFKGTSNNINFNNIVFNSTSTHTSTDKGAGIVYFDGNAEDIYFENCTFTCPKVVSNGLKFVSEGMNRSKNINILNCKFYDIGRMAIETQNHTNDGTKRITGITIKNSEFNRMGLQSPYGMAISLSGAGENAVLDNNIIADSKDRGIENVGWEIITISNNTFSSSISAYNPITIQNYSGGVGYLKNVSVTGNTGSVQGTAPHLIEIRNSDGLIYKNNSVYADALRVNDVKNSSFTENFHSSDGGIGLYVDNGSINNTFSGSTFITTRDFATTVAFYPGSTGNTLINNSILKEGEGGRAYNDMDGGNYNLDQ